MHAPLVRQSPTDKIRMAPRMRVAPKGWLIAILFAFVVLAAYFERGSLYDWFAGPRLAATVIGLSGK